MSVKFIENHKWVEFENIKQVYQLFEPSFPEGSLFPISNRVDDITLEDGTVITSALALEKLRTIAVQDHLDQTAQASGYDNIISACSYAGYANSFQAEAISFLQWRSACWDYAIQVLANVQNATRTLPTAVELVAELPLKA
jgi:hypothetical protein